MRELTNRERRLGILFGLAIFILINLMLLVFLKNQRILLQQRLAQLKSEEVQADSLLNDERFWDERAQWLDQNKPVYPLTGDAQTELVEALQQSARDHGLNATPPVLDQPRTMGSYEEVSAQVKITGDLRSVVAWMTQIQQPGKFHAIVNLSLQPDKDLENVICEVRVAKWFFLGEPAAPEAETSASRAVAPSAMPAPGLILPAPLSP